MRVLILEDEKPSSNELKRIIREYNPAFEVVGIIESVHKAVCWFNDNKQPDLILSDIQLLDENVFELFNKISITCPIIFISAYDVFAIRAFETTGIAYILKPFSYRKIETALNKFEAIKAAFNRSLLIQLSVDLSAQATSFKQRFTIKMRGGVYLLESRHIVFITVENSLCMAHDCNGKKYPMTESLQELEKQLDDSIFFRISRSEVVNINFIEKLQTNSNDSLFITMKGWNKVLTSSVSRTPKLRQWLNR